MQKNRFKKLLLFSIIIVILLINSSPCSSTSFEDDYFIEELISGTAKGEVVEILDEEKIIDEHSFARTIQIIKAKITTGTHKGKIVQVQNIIDERMAYNLKVDQRDKIVLYLEEDPEGNIVNAYVDELVRDIYLLYLLLIFILSLSIIGGLKGIKAIITLGLTIIVILKILFPLVLAGYNPIVVSVSICILVIATTIFIVGGFNKKSLAAITGTIAGVALAGVLVLLFGHSARLTGLANQEAQMLMFISEEIKFNFQGILFASIIIGSLGAIMDVGMSVASATNEIQEANPNLTSAYLIKAGMNVGRDIMGTMSNTLILAYAGGTIHLLLLFVVYEVPVMDIINQDFIASEIVRALAGSIGLIFSVPFTAISAGIIYKKIFKKNH